MRVHVGRGGVVLGLRHPDRAFACSICRCGDPTFNALGKEGIALPGLKLALDWEEVEKSQGSANDEFSEVLEHRTTLLAAWGPSERFGFFVRVPFAERDLVEIEDGETEQAHASGLADPEVSAQARIWSTQFEGDVGVRSSVFVVGGVKTDWGDNDVRRDGERLDEHVQPGTGSTDWFAASRASTRSTGIPRCSRRRNTARPAGTTLATLRQCDALQCRLRAQARPSLGCRDRSEFPRCGS